jgi:hypothetical protein
MILLEGGNAIPESNPVKQADVAGVVASAKKALPKSLLVNIQTDIGSAGYKAESGDIDLMVEAQDLIQLFKTSGEKDPTASAKKALANYFQKKNIQTKINGRNVSIGVPYENGLAQVDVMVIHDAHIVAPFHQHGTRGMYGDPDFKGSDIFLLISSIAKHLNLKFDAFGAKLIDRKTGDVVARTRDEVAKVLLNPKAIGEDLNSVKSIMRILKLDPEGIAKLKQAREDVAKGLLTLHETSPVGSPVWMREMLSRLV